MKAFITGGSGCIGQRLVRMLLDRGDTLHILSRGRFTASQHPHPRVRLFTGDLNSIDVIREAVSGCEQAYHLAAYAKNWAPSYSVYRETNVQGLHNILTICRERSIRRVLVTSTVMTLGPSSDGPVDESSIRRTPPYTEYEQSKVEAEELAGEFIAGGMDIVTVLPTRVFGPGPLTEGNSATKMIALYLKGRFRTIPGSSRAIGNWSFIDDVASGHILAMEKGRSGERYILGGENASYGEFFRSLKEASGCSLRLFTIPTPIALAYASVERLRAKYLGGYPLIVPEWVRVFTGDWACSSAKAERDLGYRITTLQEALSRTVLWLRNASIDN